MELKIDSRKPSWADLLKFKAVYSPKMAVADIGMTPFIIQEIAT